MIQIQYVPLKTYSFMYDVVFSFKNDKKIYINTDRCLLMYTLFPREDH